MKRTVVQLYVKYSITTVVFRKPKVSYLHS